MSLFKKPGAKCAYFVTEKKKVFFDSEPNLLDLALKNKIDLDHSCGGGGSCGTCRVKIVSGLEGLGARNDVEQAILIHIAQRDCAVTVLWRRQHNWVG